MNPILLLIMLALAFGAGWALAQDDECPRMILGWDCRGDFCNHCKNEVEKAKAKMEEQPPPDRYNFRP